MTLAHWLAIWEAPIAQLKKSWPWLLSAVLFNSAFPPLNFGLLVFVAMVPWLLALMKSSPKGAVVSGLGFGFVTYLWQTFWVVTMVHRWTGSLVLSIVPWVIIGLLGAVYFAALGWGMERALSLGRPWLIPLLWAGLEVVRAYIPILGFPWALAATPLWPYPSLIQPAFIGTVFVVSGWTTLVNVIVVLVMNDTKWLVVRRYVFAAVGFLLVSGLLQAREVTTTKKTIVIGQLGINMAYVDPNTRLAELSTATKKVFLASGLASADLTVLPEGLTDGGSQMPPMVPFDLPNDVAVIFGGRRGVGPIYQSAYARDRSGKWSFADKTRLVAFGEYVPGRAWMPFMEQYQLPSGDITPGRSVMTLRVGDLEVGPLICFEALFPDVADIQVQQGARLLAVLSLDDWYFGTPALDQLRAASVFRAVETGLPLVRSAPLGYSMAVDALGEIIAEAPLGKTVGMRVDVPVPTDPQQWPLRRAFPLLFVASWFLLLGKRAATAA